MSFIGDLFRSPQAPAAPDPTQLAAVQNASNEETARLQAKLNRVDTETPFGNLTFEDMGDDRWKATQTLAEPQQAQLDQQNALTSALLGTANTQAGFIPQDQFSLQGSPEFQSQFDFSGLGAIPTSNDFTALQDRAEAAVFDRGMNRVENQFADDRERMEQQLYNRGLRPGSEAYDKAIRDMNQREDEFRENLALSAVGAGDAMRQGLFANALASRGQGVNEITANTNLANAGRSDFINSMLLERGQPLNEMAALLQGSPAIQMPGQIGAPQVGVAPTDVIGANSLAQASANNAFNQQVGQQNAALGGLFSLGGSLGAAGILR